MSRKIALSVAQRGGCAYFVGGFVRDMLMGRQTESPDIDIEVHGIKPDELECILSELGEVISMGISFGVFSLRHYNIDIAMPRIEHATGRGHKDFTVFVDPFIGAENAARRRDFTINALMQNILTGEVLDFFGGQEDLEHGILRHVDDESFAEDPLRVFRCAQFAARFGFDIAPSTVKLCGTMDVSALSKERVFGETEKALLKSSDPAVYFERLAHMGQLAGWFPEIAVCFNMVKSEGMQSRKKFSGILTAAAQASDNASDKLGFMCAALSLAIAAGNRPESMWLKRISANHRLLRYCENTSEAASKLLKRFTGRGRYGKSEDKELRLLEIYDAADVPDDALLLAETVHSISARTLQKGVRTGTKDIMMEENRAALRLYKERVARPAVTGQDLIAAGVIPGPRLGEAVKLGEKLRLSGMQKDEAMRIVLKTFEDGE